MIGHVRCSDCCRSATALERRTNPATCGHSCAATSLSSAATQVDRSAPGGGVHHVIDDRVFELAIDLVLENIGPAMDRVAAKTSLLHRRACLRRAMDWPLSLHELPPRGSLLVGPDDDLAAVRAARQRYLDERSPFGARAARPRSRHGSPRATWLASERGHAVAEELGTVTSHAVHANRDIAVIVDEAVLLPAKGDRLRLRQRRSIVPLWAEGCQQKQEPPHRRYSRISCWKEAPAFAR